MSQDIVEHGNLKGTSEARSWVHAVTGSEAHFDAAASGDSASQDALKEAIRAKFPSHFVSRRDFMEWMGGLAAVLGLSSCTRQPQEKIFPYTKQPEGLVAGKPLYYATTYAHPTGGAVGVLVESQMGRPTKIEGNPEHPGSMGGTDAFTQASILDLYDPDRLQMTTHRGAGLSVDDFFVALDTALRAQTAKQGAGVRILTETVVSPTFGRQLRSVLAKFPKAQWITYDPGRGEARRGVELAFGESLAVQYRLDKVDTLVSLDSDLFGSEPGSIRYQREFSRRRREGQTNNTSPRLYAFVAQPNSTSEWADHRWPVRPALLLNVAQALAKELGASSTAAELPDDLRGLVATVAKDLSSHQGRALVVCGSHWPAELQALCFAINAKLGALGSTLVTTAPTEENPKSASLTDLATDMTAGTVDILAIFGGNPVHLAPVDVGFAAALKNVPFSFHHTISTNETSEHVTWRVPASHYLESWADARSFDGTAAIVQPLIAPLYDTKSAIEIAAALDGTPGKKGVDVVKETWKDRFSGKNWNRAVHDGVLANTAFSEKRVALKAAPALPKLEGSALSLLVRPDPTVWDGRYGNNGWLQELPKPVSKLTWENVVYVAPFTAKKLGVGNGDGVRLTANGKKVEGPVWVLPGHADECVSVAMGYGRTKGGKLSTGAGFSVSELQTAASPWLVAGVKVEKTGKKYQLACTQPAYKLEGRDIVRSATVAAFQANPNVTKPHAHHAPAAAPGHGDPKTEEVMSKNRVFGDEHYAWGMAIDLSACNGCNACVVACQSENNVPVVGKDQVIAQREMHWLRIDRYHEGSEANPETHFQPLPCMHCETAPCTVVCPVNATSISPEGINEMTYNRCVGTKYCSNNCPYKVRRFNFFQYADVDTPVLQLMRNPEVTTRARGVMEKCTFCVQRVNVARIEAKKEDRLIVDGEVTPACAAACPSEAITFGNIKDKKSRVSQAKESALNYGLLEELGTRPRTSYLAKLRNPNPAIEAALSRKSW